MELKKKYNILLLTIIYFIRNKPSLRWGLLWVFNFVQLDSNMYYLDIRNGLGLGQDSAGWAHLNELTDNECGLSNSALDDPPLGGA